MPIFDDFKEFVRENEPLAPYTNLRMGGAARAFAQPRSREELAAVFKRCAEEGVPVRIMGGGSNLLISDDGVDAIVLRLSEPAFTTIRVNAKTAHAGSGAMLSELISETARQSLGGLEIFIGIPGTVGGAISTNAGSRAGDIRQFIDFVEIMDSKGETLKVSRDELPQALAGRGNNSVVVLSVAFDLVPDDVNGIQKRMQKMWIQRKAGQPHSFQNAAPLFRDPRGASAAQLIEQAGLKETRVGGASLSDRDENYVIVHEGATARDVRGLIDLIRSRVQEQLDQSLELSLDVWD